MICWHACGRCRTWPIAWFQISWTPAGLSLTPSPFAKAGRLHMGPWGLWGCWNHSEPYAFHHHMSLGLGLSAAGTGKLDEKYASCLIQWRAFRPAADQALHCPQLWRPGTALASSLSCLRDACPSDARHGLAPGCRLQGRDGEHLKKGLMLYSLHTQKLVFLGVCNYLPASGSAMPSISGPGRKIFFPYEYVEDLA